jgi:hypothetical protein
MMEEVGFQDAPASPSRTLLTMAGTNARDPEGSRMQYRVSEPRKEASGEDPRAVPLRHEGDVVRAHHHLYSTRLEPIHVVEDADLRDDARARHSREDAGRAPTNSATKRVAG